MKEYMLRLIENSKSLTLEELLIHITMATVIGFVIFTSYWISHSGTVYSKKFNVSLIMLSILTATVMAVIGNNVALSLGMVGALSIVRYRTAIKDSRDTAYIFWAVISGICCGAGDYLIASIGTSAVFVVLLIFGRIRNDNRLLLIIRGERDLEMEIESLVFTTFDKNAKLRVKNSTKTSVELIYEISQKMYEEANKKVNGVITRLYGLGEIEYVNIVAQNDEVV